ncbi:MAG: ABC transporter ATP-binding protein [Pseudomonadota bacterium]
MLDIRNLNKSFGAINVTKGVTLSVSGATCHALIGPNGAGKTTLIHQISGVLQPDGGSIDLDGQNLLPLTVDQRALAGLGRTFQITSVLPSFTVLENVAIAVQAKSGGSMRFFGRASAESALNARALDILDQVGLADRSDTRAADMSHGELRLVELALALAGEPKFLLLDEPMAGLGQRESTRLIEFLNALRGQIPMLLVEHDMDAIFQLSDTVSVLVDGAIVATGTPEEIRADPIARAAYLGEDAA